MSKFSLKGIYQNTTLKTKVSIVFFFLLIIPMALFAFYSTYRINEVMEEQTLIAAQKTFDETFSSLSSLTGKMSDVSNILANNSAIYRIISADSESYSIFKQYADYMSLSSAFSQLKTLSGVENIQLYSKNQHFFLPLESIQQTQWYENLSTYPSKQWFAPAAFENTQSHSTETFSFMRVLYTLDDFKEVRGVLRVDISKSDYEQSLQKSTITPNSTMLLLSPEQVLLSSNDSPVLDQTSLDSILQLSSNKWELISLQSKDYFVMRANVHPSDWTVVALIPIRDVTAVSRRLTFEMLTIMLIVACSAYLLAMMIANSILKRVQRLTEATKQIHHGDTAVHLEDGNRDEIGELEHRFNKMAGRIDQLMDEKVQYGQAIKNLELKALQAQINPHFLYNTLDTINCIAIQKKTPEISNLVSSLAAFYRLSLSKGKECIQIQEEIAHSQAYVSILSSRFPNQLTAIWDISPEIEGFRMIKMVLQPIIENAAIHGIFEKENGTGTIYVKGRLEGKDVYITVEDDGIGMTQDEVKANFHPSSQKIEDTDGGYGIQNVCDRIRIAYGAEYGLSCISEIGVGTKVTIHIPQCL